MTKEEFIKELKKINVFLTEKQLEQLDKFYHILIEWNEKINLTRIIKEEDVYLKHFYDSLTLSRIVDLTKVDTLCDVGTGAGFPGIVLKICYPNLKITLIDSLNKRITYLNEVIKQLELKDITAIHVRAEQYQNKFDVVTSRAVANIEKLLTYTMHLLKKDGIFIAMKGNISSELSQEEKKKINKKYKIEKIESFLLLYENSIRNLIKITNKENSK